MITVASALFQKSSVFAGMQTHFQPKVMDQPQSNPDQLAHQRLNSALKDTMGIEAPTEVEPKQAVFDVDAVVETVMAHVTKRIDQARSNGASEADLKSLMDQARSGVETGFGQARDQIEALGKLNEGLAGKINEAENRIYQNMDDFEADLFNPSQGVTSSNVQSAMILEQYQSKKNSFSFELITQEGDKVRISASSEFSRYEKGSSAQDEKGSALSYELSQRQSAGFSLQVDGDLNEAEMGAIDDLLSQVNDLSDEFYNGDLDTAFNMALDINSDKDQIAQFSLNLRQQQVSAQQFTGFQNYSQADKMPSGLIKPLGHFAAGLQNAAETAKAFQNPHDLLQQMFEQLDSNPKFHDLLKPMLEGMQA